MLYLCVGLIVCIFVFLTAIDGPDSFARKDDTTVHLSIVRAFLDSGTYSTLNSSSFLDQGTTGSYYPSAWHIVVAIAASCIGGGVGIATNAATLAFTAIVLPLGVCLLLCTVFPNRRGVVLAGSLFAASFAIMPWGFLTKGQLLPNLAAFALIPAAIALFVSAVEANGKGGRARYAAGALIALASIALCQPNGAFTCVIGMASYALCRIFRGPQDKQASITPKKIACAVGLAAGACALWVALFFAPPLRGVVTYGTWDTLLSFPEAMMSALSFMYVKWGGIQPFLSIAVLFGLIAALRDRRWLWLAVAYVIALVIYLGNVCADGFLRQIIAGFWYSDYYRTGAMNALFAIPLAALGFAWLIRLFGSLLSRLPKLKGRETAFATAALAAVFILCQVIPFHISLGKRTIENGLPAMRHQVASLYSWDDIYTADERAFVQQAAALVEKGDTVINIPNDGTAWCYGTDGLPVLFRRTGDNGSTPSPAATNEVIRTRLANIATDEEVQQAVREVRAKYLILLDEPTGDNPTTTDQRYEAAKWEGIETITEDTPGFTLVLSEGDMRLYRIDEVA
ncbi:DUF6541 family protein [Raoultibacter phocaeensis]|uniref:DUF6541 family protein n=1 Tax=Raoultibacter phocaeensis TaxID=2479841 RepID=UPI0015D65D7F|nr:DUF6541 family protein [Raoultibacter phocaeensis]